MNNFMAIGIDNLNLDDLGLCSVAVLNYKGTLGMVTACDSTAVGGRHMSCN